MCVCVCDRCRVVLLVCVSCVEQEQQKKEEVKTQTQMVLEGQSSLGASRKRLRDLQEKLLELQDSKKAAVTG